MVLKMVDQLCLRPPVLLHDYFYEHQLMPIDACAYTDAYQLQVLELEAAVISIVHLRVTSHA
jgi:hypothetical protein